MDSIKTKELFDIVKKDYGFTDKDYMLFENNLSEPSKRIAFHAMLNEDYGDNFGTIEQFEERLGIKKKKEESLSEAQYISDGLDEWDKQLAKFKTAQENIPADADLRTPAKDEWVDVPSLTLEDPQAPKMKEINVGGEKILAEEAGVYDKKGITNSFEYVLSKGYNESTIGLVDNIINGKERIDLSNYESNKVEDAIAFAISMAMDAPIFVVSGGIGGAAAKGAARGAIKAGEAVTKKLIKRGVKKEVANKIVKKGIEKYSARIGANAAALGVYGAEHEALGQMVGNKDGERKEFKDIEWKEVQKEGYINAALGGALGVLSVSGGALEKYLTKNLERQASKLAVQGGMRSGEFLAENAAFLYGDAALREEVDMKDIGTEEWTQSLITLGTLKVSGKLQQKGGELLTRSKNFTKEKINKDEFKVEFTKEELGRIGAKDTKGAFKKIQEQSLETFIENKDIPFSAKRKVLWSTEGVRAGIPQNIQEIKMQTYEGKSIVEVYNNKKELLEVKEYDNINQANKDVIRLAEIVKDRQNRDKAANLTPKEKVEVEDRLLTRQFNRDIFIEGINKNPEARTIEERQNIKKFNDLVDETISKRTQGEKEALQDVKKIEKKAETPEQKKEEGIEIKQQEGIKDIKKEAFIKPEESLAASKKAEESIPVGIMEFKGEPKKTSKILQDLQKNLGGKKILFGKPLLGKKKKGIIGEFDKKSEKVMMRKPTDLETAPHEVGHFLDKKFGLYEEIKKQNKLKELDKFAESGSTPPSDYINKQEYIQKEGIAEFIRAYSLNPKEAVKASPELYKIFEKKMPGDVKNALKIYGEDVRNLYNSDPIKRIGANVQTEKQKKNFWKELKEPFVKQELYKMNWVDRFTSSWLNPFRGYEKAFKNAVRRSGQSFAKIRPSENTNTLARLLLGKDEKFYSIYEEGMVDAKGSKLTDKKGNVKNWGWLLNPAEEITKDKSPKNVHDFVNYSANIGIAKRTVEMAHKFAKRDIIEDISKGKLPSDNILRQYDVSKDILNKAKKLKDMKLKGEKLNGKEIKIQSDKKYDYTKATLTGINQGQRGVSDYDIAKAALRKFDHLKYLDKKKYETINEMNNRYIEYADDVMKYAVEKGRLSKEQYDLIKETNSDYIALKRIQESEPGVEYNIIKRGKGGKLGTATEVTHKIKGSAKEIIDPYVSLMESTKKIIYEADRNEAMRAFTDVIEKIEGGHSDLAVKAVEGDMYTIPVFKNGEKEVWRWNKDIYESLKALDDAGYRVHPALTIPAKVLRYTITKDPRFLIRNRQRDFALRFNYSRGKSDYKDFISKERRREARKEFEITGGGQFGYYSKGINSYYDLQKEGIKKISKEKNTLLKIKNKGIDLVNLYDKTLGKSEKATRLEQYLASKRKGMEKVKKGEWSEYDAKIQATFDARDLLDFKVCGYHMRMINQMIPFSNARIQGFRKMVREFGHDPAKTTARLAIYSMIPQVLNSLLISQLGDEKIKEYKQMPHWRRDMFYNIPLGKDWWITWPKAFEVGIMTSAIGRSIDMLVLNDKDAYKDGYVGWLMEVMSPTDPSIITGGNQAIKDVMTNWDSFRKKYLVSPYQKDKAVSRRKGTEDASRIGKVVAKLSDDWDPRVVDHFIKAQFGYFGKTALKAGDIGRKDSRYKFDLSDTGQFKKSYVYGEKNVQWILGAAKKYELEHTDEYKEFKNIVEYYFNTEDKEHKRLAAEALRDYAEILRKHWENINIKERGEK